MVEIKVADIIHETELLRADGSQLGMVAAKALASTTDELAIDFAGIHSVSLSAACLFFTQIVKACGERVVGRMIFRNIAPKAESALEIGYDEAAKSLERCRTHQPVFDVGL